MDTLNPSLWQQRSHRHEGLSLLSRPHLSDAAELGQKAGKNWNGAASPANTAAGDGPEVGAGVRRRRERGGMTHCAGRGARGPAPAAEVIAWKPHPRALRFPPSRRHHLCTGSGADSSPMAPSLALHRGARSSTGPSAGTRALCAWSSVPAYSTHLPLCYLPA